MSDDELDPNTFYKTNDMALVTYLRIQGHPVQGTRWLSNSCVWVFRINDNLLGLVDNFMDDRALVNPKEFNRHFTDTKKELYSQRETMGAKAS